jgi:hypothetical protein
MKKITKTVATDRPDGTGMSYSKTTTTYWLLGIIPVYQFVESYSNVIA